MIRLRNLDKGSAKFNNAMIAGTSANPWSASADSPMLDLQNIFYSLTTGWTGIRMTVKQGTTAQASGTNYCARFRAENAVLTSIGTLVGLNAQAANTLDSASLVVLGASIEALAKGKNASEVRALDVIADNTEGTGTVTTMHGVRVRVIGAGTVTNGPWGVHIFDDAGTASAAAKPLKAFVYLEGNVTSFCAIDATAADLRGAAQYSITLTSKDNVLFYYKDFDGTAHAVVASDGDALAIRS